jgi:phospholipase C
MIVRLSRAAFAAGALYALALQVAFAGEAPAVPSNLDRIENIVVLYAENRSFDNLYGLFPGANGLAGVGPEQARQLDRDGTLLRELPPVWGGFTPAGFEPAIGQDRTAHLPNAPFAIDDPAGLNAPLGVPSRDLSHRFYENQMQINRGRNDKFVAFGDSGALAIGHYSSSSLPLWSVAQRYVLADNFFMAAFGGSFLNHFYLACACAPVYPGAGESAAKDQISAVEPDGVSLTIASDSPPSAMDQITKFVADRALTPDLYAVNTMQPPYQPSAVKPTPGGDPAYADLDYHDPDPTKAGALPPQTAPTIGDLLSEKGVSWAWYAGAWDIALKREKVQPNPSFQTHHQPFNYFASFAPGTPARAEHLRDGGLNGAAFIAAIDAGTLPRVAFYKPQGSLNEHPGYADVLDGDAHLADLVAHLEKSPQWPHMVVIIAYDENGGFWDHVAPPKGDRFGPGTRIPALIVSPFAKKGAIDHTLYDTTSILRLITRRFGLPELPGLRARAEAIAAGGESLGDLTAALDLASPDGGIAAAAPDPDLLAAPPISR